MDNVSWKAERMKGKDVRTFEHRTICHMARRIVGARDAEDVAQDIAIELWQRRDRFISGHYVRHRCYDHLRSERSRRRRQRHVGASEYHRRNEAAKETDADLSSHIEAMIAKAGLTEAEEKVLRHRFWDDMSYAEIVQHLKIGKETVWKRLKQSVEKLRSVVEECQCRS